jgi:predicted HicB family RNase H-like nuclease
MTKTLKISEKTHQKLKIYCAKNKLKISWWVEKCIKEGIKTLLIGK